MSSPSGWYIYSRTRLWKLIIHLIIYIYYEYILNIFTLANIWGKSKDKISKYRFDLTMFVCHKRDNYISCLWDYNILAISNAPLNMMDAELGCTTTSIFIKISQKALSEALKISLALFLKYHLFTSYYNNGYLV